MTTPSFSSYALPDYAELYCQSNYSFLQGASHPEELVQQAFELNYMALAITDECSVAGVVRAHAEVERLNKPFWTKWNAGKRLHWKRPATCWGNPIRRRPRLYSRLCLHGYLNCRRRHRPLHLVHPLRSLDRHQPLHQHQHRREALSIVLILPKRRCACR